MSPRAPVGALLLVLAASPAAADYVVFRDGRSLKVTSVRFEGESTAVELPGGGRMSFSSAVVRYVAPDEDVEQAPPVRAAAAPSGLDAGEAREAGDTGEAWTAFADPRWVDSIRRVSERHALDPALVAAVVKVESDFRPRAVSPKGAKGLMQLMPITAREHGVDDPLDPEKNLEGGAAHLRELLSRYGGDLTRALAAYNAGQTAVDRARGVPRFPETQVYVARVMAYAGRAFASAVD